MSERKKNTAVNPEIAGARGLTENSLMDSSSLPKNDSVKVQNGDKSAQDVGASDAAGMDESERIANAMIDSSDSAGIDTDVSYSEKKEELIDFIFPWRPDEYKYFECSINCIKYRFEKGVPVKIPRCVYDLYITLNKDLVTADKIKSGMPQNV